MEVFFLIDNSGSMDGNPIHQACNIAKLLSLSLGNNSVTKDVARGSIIGYNVCAKIILPTCDISELNVPALIDCIGPKNLGEALKLAADTLSDSQDSCLFIITKGTPSDIQLYKEQTARCKILFSHIYILHGKIDKSSIYKDLSNNILPWDNVNCSKLISKIYGGQETTDTDGNELLQAPPSIIKISI